MTTNNKISIEDMVEYLKEWLRQCNEDGLDKWRVTLAISKALKEYNWK